MTEEREKLAQRLSEHAKMYRNANRPSNAELMDEAAAALRQPPPAQIAEIAAWHERQAANLADAGNERGADHHRRAADVLRRLAPSPGEGWRPIESAPKDGQAIFLLSRPYTDDCPDGPFFHPVKCHIGRWNPEGTSWVSELGLLPPLDAPEEGTYVLATTGIWESGGGWFQPDEVTDWCPLPAPPSAETEGK